MEKSHPQQNELLDFVTQYLQVKNDAALVRATGVAAPIISRLRGGHIGVTARTLLAFHDAGVPLADLRAHLTPRTPLVDAEAA
jgi:hypothetical protein